MLTAFDHIPEAGLAVEREAPLFPVEPKDKRVGAEIDRQAAFVEMMAWVAPDALVAAVPNGTYTPSRKAMMNAQREGVKAGWPDLVVTWNRGVAFIEFKRGDATVGGKSAHDQDQVRTLNALYRQGHHVAVFRTPEAAVAWLVDCGCPVKRKVAA